MVLPFVFIFGLLIGSFLNVLILRHNTGMPWASGKSKCFHCNKNLEWYELIPVFSFMAQKGRCGGCRAKISLQYPLVELITAFIFALSYLKFSEFFSYLSFYLNSPSPSALKFLKAEATNYFPGFQEVFFIAGAWIFFSVLIVISVYDLYHKIIPNFYSHLLFFFSLAFAFFSSVLFFGFTDFFYSLLSGFLFFLIFFLLSFVSNERWMGYGDSKLAVSLGLFLGPLKSFLTFLFSFWIGAIAGIFILIFLKKTGLKTQIPFAPFLALAAFLSFLIEIDFLLPFLLRFY